MSFASYWARKIRANQRLKQTSILRIGSETFKKELQKAYDEGYRDGAKMMKQLGDIANNGEIDALRKSLQDG
jgi:hypothetical protein